MNTCSSKHTAIEVFTRLYPGAEPKEEILEYFFQRLREGLFEERSVEVHMEWEALFEGFLEAYAAADKQEREEGETFLARYPLRFLTPKEIKKLESPKEYLTFHRAFERERVYLLLKLDRDLHGFSTVEHILGVHHLAMKLGRDVVRAGIPVDLGLLSGAAAGHDLGKYGVKPQELHRIAYYHYYYSDLWFARRGMEQIRNIAVNHSTWDLEPESLSMESLLLIYSDFRVKNDASGQMRFYDLKESFQVILDKLDNVDAAKELRYRKVYNKLADFEKYLLHHGIEVAPEGESGEAPPDKDPALRFGQELTAMLHLEGVRQSTQMMYLLRSEDSIGLLFEEVISGKEPQDILRLLDTLSDYSMYLRPSQKREILRYLQSLTFHSREDVRRKTAALKGQIIGEYDIVYRKELPPSAEEETMEKEMLLLFEDLLYEIYRPYPMMSEEKVLWLTHGAYRSVVRSMERQEGNVALFLEPLLRAIMRPGDRHRRHLSYRLIDGLWRRGWIPTDRAKPLVSRLLEENPQPEDFHRTLYFNIDSDLFDDSYREEGAAQWELLYGGEGGYDAPRMYLDNLKTETPEDIKALSLLYLCNTSRQRQDPLHLSIHMLNLIRVSASRQVRRYTFQLVPRMIAQLSKAQLNDVSVELLGSLANEDPQSQEFLCDLYGQLLARLSPAEREEILFETEIMIKTSPAPMRNALVKAVSYGLRSSLLQSQRIPGYLRVIFGALVHSGGRTEQLALISLADQIFRSEEIRLEDKAWVLTQCVKKVRLLSKSIRSGRITQLSYGYYIASVYGFLSEYELEKGELLIPTPSRIALYSGCFDPMNLGQRRIVQRMCDEGYEVYVLLSEFASNRRLYPYANRRIIASINIAPIPGAYLMPHGYSFLPSREEDRQQILRDFSPAKVTLLGEEDVKEGPIREIDVGRLREEEDTQWMKIRPSMIRYALREGLDTIEMIDPMAARYITRNHLYLNSQHEKVSEPFAYVIERNDEFLQVRAREDDRQMASAQVELGPECLRLSSISELSPDPLHPMFSFLLSEAVFLATREGKAFLEVHTQEPKQKSFLGRLGYEKTGSGYRADLSKLIVIIEDLPTRLQVQMRSDSGLRSVIAKTREKFYGHLSRLYPGKMILPLAYSLLYGHHLRMIDALGKDDHLYVPISDLFYGQHFAGRRTKALHLKESGAKEEENYLSLEHQLQILGKLGSRVLFIDDAALLSQELVTILPQIREKGIPFAGLLSGVASENYREQMAKEGVELFCENMLPGMEAVFYESDFFPFFGGRTQRTSSRGLRRSRNLLFPMAGPAELFRPEGDYPAFSRSVLKLGRKLMQEIERAFRSQYDRSLHVGDLFRVFDAVRVPEMLAIRPSDHALDAYEELMKFNRSMQERWEV